MALVHHVLAFYWEKKLEVDEYLARVEQKLAQMRGEVPTLDVAGLQKKFSAKATNQKAAS